MKNTLQTIFIPTTWLQLLLSCVIISFNIVHIESVLQKNIVDIDRGFHKPDRAWNDDIQKFMYLFSEGEKEELNRKFSILGGI
jgi:hypothetical protein